MDLGKEIEKAKTSSFRLWWLNFILQRGIPFNKPHRLKIVNITSESVEVKIPYIRRNLNHIKGLHACSMATAAEFSAGILLVSQLDPKKYRLIMESFEMKYHYQGKNDSMAKCQITTDWLNANVIQPLNSADQVLVKCETKVYDTAQNHLCTGTTVWQIKNWDKVRTRVV